MADASQQVRDFRSRKSRGEIESEAFREEQERAEALQQRVFKWNKQAQRAGTASRHAKSTGDGIYATAFNLDIKNPHTVTEDHGEPENLLEDLTAAEAEVAAIREQLKAILTEAFAR